MVYPVGIVNVEFSIAMISGIDYQLSISSDVYM